MITHSKLAVGTIITQTVFFFFLAAARKPMKYDFYMENKIEAAVWYDA